MNYEVKEVLDVLKSFDYPYREIKYWMGQGEIHANLSLYTVRTDNHHNFNILIKDNFKIWDEKLTIETPDIGTFKSLLSSINPPMMIETPEDYLLGKIGCIKNHRGRVSGFLSKTEEGWVVECGGVLYTSAYPESIRYILNFTETKEIPITKKEFDAMMNYILVTFGETYASMLGYNPWFEAISVKGKYYFDSVEVINHIKEIYTI